MARSLDSRRSADELPNRMAKPVYSLLGEATNADVDVNPAACHVCGEPESLPWPPVLGRAISRGPGTANHPRPV